MTRVRSSLFFASLLLASSCKTYVVSKEEGPTPPLISSRIQDPPENVTPITAKYFDGRNTWSPAVIDSERIGFVTDLNDNLDIFYLNIGEGTGSGPSSLVDTGYDEKNPVFVRRPRSTPTAEASTRAPKEDVQCLFATRSSGTVGIYSVSFPKVQGMSDTLTALSHANWPDISGDRKHMLYSVLDRRGRYVTYMYSFETGKKTFITRGQRARFHPLDPNRFAFTRRGVDGKWDLFTFDLRSGADKLTSGEDAFDPSYSPDGRYLAFASNRSGSTDIEVLNLATSQRSRVVTHGAIDCQPVWSADGRHIFFVSNRGGSFGIYQIEFEDKERAEPATAAGK